MGKNGLRTKAAILAAILSATGVNAQVSWQTTHALGSGTGSGSGTCGLESSAMRVSIFPAYLEVEEDAEISVLGAVEAGADPKTLEITGTFSMPAGTAIVGALLWDGDRILQGKLLDRRIADSLYEEIVDRNPTPPARPRDPLILELIAKDTYRFKIYPVDLGHSRRIRLRYQLPPVIGADGIEMSLRAAIAPLFPSSPAQVSVTFRSGTDIGKAILVTSQGVKTQMTLPRTRLMLPADFSLTAGYDPWMGWVYNPGVRILPVDPLRQVMLKTTFPDGQMAGNYLNLYTSVTDDVLQGLNRKTEVVVFWKWQNPGAWIHEGNYGVDMETVYQAQSQAASILEMYNAVGGAGTKLGLLHDDSKSEPHVFKASTRGQPEYTAAVEYLRSVQGAYPAEFARNMIPPKGSKPGNVSTAIKTGKNRFVSDLHIVKSLYSAESGTTRYLVMLTAGSDYASAETDMNAAFDSVFAKDPVSVAAFGDWPFSQAGFNLWQAHRDHHYEGATSFTPWGELPILPRVNLNVVVRNASKSYDFSIACDGGMAYNCGNLTFHGKSDSPWLDSLEWEAYDGDGKAVGSVKTKPTIIEHARDTAIALLWAGSGSAFSEKKELPLGPVFGFVDRWASLLSLQKDTLGGSFSDSGVPRISNARLTDVIPNYDGGYKPDPSSIAAKVAGLSDPASWRIERTRNGMVTVRIPGLNPGMPAEVELFDLAGKRAGRWNPRSVSGSIDIDASLVRTGVYLMKIKVAGFQAVKRVAI
ncbi:MAG: hypothetical protein JWP91_67 [Fibrobacteres bacterium]|nr:hypothetical protein [Fibrobacterota bacterium]